MSGITLKIKKGSKLVRLARDLLFDVAWYKKQLEGDQLENLDYFQHFMEAGVRQGLSPHPLFDTKYYISVAGSDFKEANPLLHFLETGWRENLSPSRYFNIQYYLNENPDVAELEMNPLVHFIRHGADEGRRPNGAFDTAWYILRNPGLQEAGINPLAHWIAIGKVEGRSQNAAEELVLRQRRQNAAMALRPVGTEIKIDFTEGKYIEPPSAVVENGLASIEERQATLVSFDVWDTLLRRRCYPDEIKLQTARYLFVEYYWLIRPAFRSVVALYQARQRAEALSSPHGDWEFRLDDALLYCVNEVVEPHVEDHTRASIAAALLEHEIEAEVNATFPDETARVFLNGFERLPVVVMSDFYLGGETIKRLLQKNGYTCDFLKVYSSSDYYANKRNGTLFSILKSDFSSNGGDLIHIGDSLPVDVEAAVSQGLQAVHYVNHSIEKYKLWLKSAFDANISGDPALHTARVKDLAESLADGLKLEKSEDRSEYEARAFGARFAPVALGFVLHIIEQAKRFNVASVNFLTREGIFFQKAYDVVTAADPFGTSYVESRLVEVSRIATFAPSLDKINAKNLMRMWNLYSTQSPEAFCKSLNFDAKKAKKFFSSRKIDFSTPIEYPWLDEKFTSILEGPEFLEFAREQIDPQRKLLKQYLEQVGFEASEPSELVVDLGWRGTIQDNLAHTLNTHIHGCYLGLFRLINEQPRNASKSAWLFDLNEELYATEPEEIAPLEMIFNGPGGSVTSYAAVDGMVKARRKVIPAEEEVINAGVAAAQRGMLEALPRLVQYVRLHALTSEELRTLGKELVADFLANPPPAIADLFLRLQHNETFGTGHAQKMGLLARKGRGALKSLRGSHLHAQVNELYVGSRWKSGLLNSTELSKSLKPLDDRQVRALPSKVYRSYTGPHGNAEKKIAFYAPAPIAGSGGHRTIFNVARKLSSEGFDIRVFLESAGEGEHVARGYLGDAAATVELGWQAHFQADMAFATIAHSASYVRSLKHVEHRAYLIQDCEALFNPVGDAYRNAEHSYTCIENNFTIGNWLSHMLATQYAQRSVPAGLGIDTRVYKPDGETERENAICLLYQPEKPRRSPDMAISALRIVKKILPRTKIYVYGSNAPINVDFEVENLGLVHDLAMLNRLYNRCKIGLCISMSNPSRIPFEMMAAGTVPVDVYRYNNLMDYESGTIKLAYQTEFSLARAMVELLEDKEGWQNRSQSCFEFARPRSLEWETDIIANNVMAVLAGDQTLDAVPTLSYLDAPVLAETDNRPETKAFCEWQRKMAGSWT